MTQITYRGDGFDVTIELGKPTIRSGVLESLVYNVLLEKAITTIAKGQVVVFARLVKHTRHISGLPFAWPDWNATEAQIQETFLQWLELDGGLGDIWYEGVEAIMNETPLSQAAGNASKSTETPPPSSPKPNSAKARRNRSAITTSAS